MGRGDAQCRRLCGGIDRHVELAGDLAWSASLLDHFEPPDDHRRPWKGRSHSPIQVEGEVDHERLADTLVAITQLAERLDRGTLELALRIVPVGWWAARLGKTPPAPTAELELVIGDQPAS